MPITASWETRRVGLRVRARTTAPSWVAPRPNQYDAGSSGSRPTSKAAATPRAAIWASVMSTKTTSRAITWMPRYAWIPVRTRHIKNGTHMRATRSAAMGVGRLPESLRQRVHVVGHPVEVGVGALHRPRPGGHEDEPGPAVGGEALGELSVPP